MKEILPIVMNSQFERLAVIDEYNSLIWTTRYYTCGDFELCVDIDEKTNGLFRKGYYIIREDDENVGVVEKIQIVKNEDDHETLIVSGRFLSSILGRRIISKQTVVSGAVSKCVNTLLTNEVINPTISARKIENFILGSYSFTDAMQGQYTGANLLEKIIEICQTYGLGFKVTLNYQNQFVFQLFEGTDHSYGQSENPYVVFSDKYDNLLSSQYVEDYQNIVTDVLVAGEGEGLDRKTLWVTAGTNLMPNKSKYWEQGGLNSSQNVDNSTALQTRIRLITGIHVQPNTTYVITKTAGTAIGIHQMTAEGGKFVHDSLWQTGTTYSFTTEPNCTFIRICFRYDPSADISISAIGTSIVITMVESDSGLNRYEMYKDQRQLQTNGGEITEANYQAQMRESGLESITTITTAFTGTVYFGNLQWKHDVNIGDICVIENKRWGIYINSRLVEVIESVAETGEYSIVPSFGI
jgi:hypothetical protein